VVDGAPVANAVAGGKRPRSSMAPVIVLDATRRPVAALGSPGGSSILAYNAKTIVGLLAWKLPLPEAIELPNMIARGDEYFGEVVLPEQARAAAYGIHPALLDAAVQRRGRRRLAARRQLESTALTGARPVR
jgi:gamma-glutamyltranspeptidase/glutathione hydrolase